MSPGGTRGVAVVTVVVCFVGLAAAVAAVGTTGVATANEELNVSVDTSKTDVWVTESFDVTVTAENIDGDRYSVEQITLVDSGGTTVATREPFGARIDAGERSEFSFSDIAVSVPGRGLEAVVELKSVGSGPSSRLTEVARAPVEVSQPDPVTDLTGDRSAGAVSLTIGNPNEDPLRRIEVGLEQPTETAISLLTDQEVIPTLQPNETRELTFDVQGIPTGSYAFDLALEFETDDGTVWERTRSATVEFADQPTGDSVLDVSNVTVSNAPNGVEVSGSVFTSGDATVRNVEVEAADVPGTGPVRPAPEAFITEVGSDETGAFELTAALSDGRSTVPLTLEYVFSGVEQTTTIEVPYAGPRDNDPVQLTNLNINGATISGEVANTGETTASGVTVGFADAENVAGGDEFFAGSIDAGEFQPLESISAQLTGERSTLPVTISYTIDGVQYQTVSEVSIADDSAPSSTGQPNTGGSDELPAFDPQTDSGGDDGGDDPPVMVIGGVAAVAIALVGLVVYRRR